MRVNTKLIPDETGITKVKSAVERALNITSAEIKIRENAPMTCTFKRKLTQCPNSFNTLPLRFHLIMAAPETLRMAYKKQNRMALIKVDLVEQYHQ